MKKETTQKKIWQKPEVQDLDVKKTAKDFSYTEHTHSGTYTHGPAAS